MSFDLGIFYSAGPLTQQDAARRYAALCKRDLNDADSLRGLVEPNEAVAVFAGKLTTLYPQPRTLPDEEVDDSPWNCDLDISAGHVIVTMAWSRCREVAPQVTELALKEGLVVFDPQKDRVYLPTHIGSQT